MKLEDIYQFFQNPPPTYLSSEQAVGYVLSVLLQPTFRRYNGRNSVFLKNDKFRTRHQGRGY